MNQKKIGAFMRSLRMERGITQENLAEQLNVAGRTVSRWETGHNMPDISLLLEIADFYQVEVSELLDGERSHTENNSMNQVIMKLEQYSKNQLRRLRMIVTSLAIIAGLAALLLQFRFEYTAAVTKNNFRLEYILVSIIVVASFTVVFIMSGYIGIFNLLKKRKKN